MKQAFKDSIVKGIKVALFLSLIALMGAGVYYIENTYTVTNAIRLIISPFIGVTIITVGLYFCKAENPFIFFKLLLIIVASIILLGTYLIVPIALVFTKTLPFVFLGVVIGCIQVCFLCSKPVLEVLTYRFDNVEKWIG